MPARAGGREVSWKAAWTLGITLCASVILARLVQDPETGTMSWDASRAAGFATYLLLWLSVVAGIALHMRFKLPGVSMARALEFHRIVSALSLSFLAAHVLAIILDPYIAFSWVDGFVPFTSDWEPFAVGVGTISQWLLVLVLASTALAAKMPYTTWKKLHYLSFPSYALALLHGILSGTDTGQFAAIMLYAMTASAVAFLIVFRIAGRDWAKEERRLSPVSPISPAATGVPGDGAWSALQQRLFGQSHNND